MQNKSKSKRYLKCISRHIVRNIVAGIICVSIMQLCFACEPDNGRQGEPKEKETERIIEDSIGGWQPGSSHDVDLTEEENGSE